MTNNEKDLSDKSVSQSREIKFRVWTGYDNGNEGMVFSDDCNCCVWDSISYDYKPIMQYTGLKDKNGIEIYEGDILGYRRTTDFMPKKSLVEFDHNVGAWYCGGDLLSSVLHEQNNDERKKDANYTVKKEQYAVIIGNIYQNPELLSDI